MFQSTIIKKYLSSQNKDTLISKWDLYRGFFHNKGNQDRIRELKEEQFQEGFLKELFVKIFGYIITPNENYNLVTEFKNVKDSRKVDGALVFNKTVKCVIELKGTNTTDLEKVENQAFSYKNNQPNCSYVITSNFEKLRFYIQDATEFIEYDLFKLTQDEFNILYLCLNSESIESDLPLKLKNESISQEDLVTKQLYQDYSLFKRELFQNLIELNQGYDKLLLFKKSQKLLDRFLFLFFAEDRFLLPPNSVRLILDDWEDLIEKDVEVPLYNRFKKYFGYLNTGFKGKRYDVFPYNGGLFKPDDVLDSILIDDRILFKHTKKLSEYDFESEVDVNILGHIFENSLNEIEEISNELMNDEIDTTNSKRKKDGVFYTPKYITKYIVKNTIGKLCNEKKKELQINEEDYTTDKKRIKKTIKNLSDKLTEYRNWLLQLTICDPACGSGAFLNQSLDFLILEHQYIDELQSKLFGDSMILSDIENSILENNLFGVDINEESVEITKLSLWLRTAQPNRKLNNLSSNIKCGNSLIDEPIEGVENYFKWEQEFPKVFENGGFDVVIGNPPYTYRNTHEKNIKEFFKHHYLSNEGNFDLYKFFIEKLIYLTKSNGFCSYIVPNTFLSASTYKKLRKLIIENFEVLELFDLGLDVFENVVVESVMFNFRKTESGLNDNVEIKIQRNRNRLYSNLEEHYFIDIKKYGGNDNTFNIYISDKYSKIIDKIQSNSIILSEICYCTVGINTGYIKNELTSNEKIDTRYFKMLSGKDIGRNFVQWNGEYIMYDFDFVKSKGDRGRSLPPEHIFTDEKILVQRTRRGMQRKLVCYYDDEKYYNLNRLSNIVLINKDYNLKFIYGILNSKLMDFYFNTYFNEYEVKPIHLSRLPISLNMDKGLESKMNIILLLNKELLSESTKFQRTLQRKFEIDKLPKKLQDWYLLSYNEFIKELSKKKIKLSLSEESEWEDFFIQESNKALDIKSSIEDTDKEIDRMVYQLYNLTDDEIEIIESSM
tara:strand:- start:10392 stop:13394 length:3003 start_codon:yes stop_codon:yes gene_type:complete